MTKELSGTPEANPSSDGPRTFPSACRILRSADFRKVYDNGVRISNPFFVAFCWARPDPDPDKPQREGPRLGLTVPRAVGKATVRNRIKRRLREVFRLHRDELDARWDIVLNPRRQVLDAGFDELETALGKVIRRCGNQ